MAPGLAGQLAQACAPYVTVVPPDVSMKIMRSGWPAQSVLVEARRLPIPAEMSGASAQGVAWLTLDVTLPGEPSYRSTIRWGHTTEERFTELSARRCASTPPTGPRSPSTCPRWASGWSERTVMGWLADRKIRRMTDPADGTLLVNATNGPPSGEAVYQNFRFTGVVEAPGLPPTAVEVHGMAAPEAKWPQPGQRLPVTVDRTHPDRVVIRWAEVPTARELAMYQARSAETRLRTGIDPDVLAEAIAQTSGSTPAAVEPALPADRTDGRWATPPPVATTVPATGVVIAVRDVQMPAGFGPAGGVADLTIQLTDDSGTRTAVARTPFTTPEERAGVAEVGATVPVLIDPADPHAITVRLPG